MAEFFIIVRETDRQHCRHPSKSAARKEAERLARKEGGRFYVLAAFESVASDPVPVKWTSHLSDNLTGLPIGHITFE